jgi:LysM repeat protein
MFGAKLEEICQPCCSLVAVAYSMDPGPGFGGDVYTTFVTNFEQTYNGNRAPFPMYLHAPWFTDDNIAATNKFIEYALSKGDVYFVTMKELINWMENPISASEYQKKANCKPVNVSKATKEKCQTYIVQPGDFLQSIAGKFGIINVKDLVSVNPDVQVMTLKPGDTVKIPPWDASCTSGGTAQSVDLPSDQNVSTSEPILIPETLTQNEATNLPVAETRPIDIAPPPMNEICKVWTVVQGDFLGGVAKATGVSIDEIVRINKLFDSTVPLIVGQNLKIPPYPDCCDSGTCDTNAKVDAPADIVAPIQEAPTRVDISFSLNGVTDWNDEVKETLTKILENEFGVQESGLEIVVVASRRSRRLSQVTPDNPIPLRVSISTENPDSLYQVIRSELE